MVEYSRNIPPTNIPVNIPANTKGFEMQYEILNPICPLCGKESEFKDSIMDQSNGSIVHKECLSAKEADLPTNVISFEERLLNALSIDNRYRGRNFWHQKGI